MAIASVGGATNASTVNVTTLSVTYSPTAGNTVLIWLCTAGITSNYAAQDNLGNPLKLNIPFGNTLASFSQVNVPSGVTGYTVTWTTASQASVAVQEYSGAPGVQDFNFSNSGNSATATVSQTITEPNNWIVAGMGAPNTLTASVGTQRQQVTTSTARLTILDNTSAVVGSVTNTCTLTASQWSAISVEIGGVGRDRVNQDITLVVKQSTGSRARANQDVLLVVKAVTSAKARVNQDVLLVVKSNAAAPITQQPHISIMS